MKNLRALTHSSDLLALYSPLFQRQPIIQLLCKVLVRGGPVFIAEEDQEVERGHFGTYFGVILDRPEFYADRPIIRDLYLIHEMMHWHTMQYRPGKDWSWHAWFKKMLKSEFLASVFSEAYIYFHIPELRPLAFPHEIWVDRFITEEVSSDTIMTGGEIYTGARLKPNRVIYAAETPQLDLVEGAKYPVLPLTAFDGALTDRWQVGNHMRAIAQERRRTMDTPSSYDFLELQIQNYRESNVAWCRVWGSTYRMVEDHMHAMAEAWRSGGRVSTEQIIQDHMAWLDAHRDPYGVCFRSMAEQFIQVYKGTKNLYGNDILMK